MSLLKNKKLLIILFIFLVVIAIGLKFLFQQKSSVKSYRPMKPIHTVLVGDSNFKGAFGNKFLAELAKKDKLQKDQIAIYAISKSTFANWVDGNFQNTKNDFLISNPNHPEFQNVFPKDHLEQLKIAAILKDTKPKRIVFNLGTHDFLISSKIDDKNERASRNVVIEIRNKLNQVISENPGIQCNWIGPVLNSSLELSLEKQNRLFNELKYAISSTKCNFLDSRDLPLLDYSKLKSVKPENCRIKNKSFELDTKDSVLITNQKLDFWGYCSAIDPKL